MQDRKSETYHAVFESISKKFDELLNVKLSPKVIKVDFEQIVISAIQQCFPEAKVTGCNFHFNQSSYRRVQHEGLVQDYRENTEVQQHIRMVAALAHLPEDEVIDGWLAVMEDCVTDNSKINGWNDYFVSQWLENPHLPISTWNVCGEEHQTNNTCEGYI